MLNTNQLEPKMENRFIVNFPKQFASDPCTVQSINKPKFINGKWGNIKIEFVDTTKSVASKSLYKIVDLLTNSDDESVWLFMVTISSLDALGNPIDTWEITVKNVLEIDFGDLNYNSNEVQRPSLLLEPFSCSFSSSI